MSVAIYIVLDGDSTGTASLVDGTIVGREIEALDELAAQLDIAPLSNFVSMSVEEFQDLMGEEDVPDGAGEKWFGAEEGLTVLRLVAARIEAEPEAVSDGSEALTELRGFIGVLEDAKRVGAKWHFAYDV